MKRISYGFIRYALLAVAISIAASRSSFLLALQRAPALPERLSDAAFWGLVSSISEPGGYFRIVDNFTSNENEIGRLAGRLETMGAQGGVYIGVGPEQNLTYIAALKPPMAFIVDIRRQAVMQHLMFKAIFEMSNDRADFISLLFSKPRPAGIERETPIPQIWNSFSKVRTDSDLAAQNHAAIVDRLKKHQFTFTAEESSQLDLLLDAFVQYGPSIMTNSGGRGGGNNWTFEDLTGASLDDAGQPQSFLSTDEHFQTVKTLHEKNLIVPVSGDFGGPKAIREIGAYLHERQAFVRAFYVSNVEQYLFQDDKATAFYENVAALPLHDSAVFIRPYAMRQSYGTAEPLCGIVRFLAAAKAGRAATNNQALSCPQ
jgi:hypothetical protein